MIDWINTLAAQDQSLEGLMAKQDLGRKMALLNDVVRTGQQKDIQDQNRVEKGREFDLRLRELKDAADERKQRQDQIEQDRKQGLADRATTERRNRYNTVVDNLRTQVGHGVTPKISDQGTADLVREFEGPGAVEPEMATGQDPTKAASWLYRKQEAETVALKLKHEQERQDHQQKLQDLADARAAAELKLRTDAAGRAQQKFDRQQKALDEHLSTMPPEIRAQAAKEATMFAKANTQGTFEGDEPYQERIHKGIADIYDRIEQEAIAKGRMQPRSPKAVGPSGAYLPDEEAKQVLGSAWVPGTKVRRVPQ